VASDWMHAGESQLPRVPTVPKGFKRKVVLCPWVYDAALRNQEEQRSKIDRHVYYIPWDDAADKPAGKRLCSLSQKDSVEEYIRRHPLLGLTLGSFCFVRYIVPTLKLASHFEHADGKWFAVAYM
jgi:hypothetical protein